MSLLLHNLLFLLPIATTQELDKSVMDLTQQTKIAFKYSNLKNELDKQRGGSVKEKQYYTNNLIFSSRMKLQQELLTIVKILRKRKTQPNPPLAQVFSIQLPVLDFKSLLS